jgi:hypothetical protein
LEKNPQKGDLSILRDFSFTPTPQLLSAGQLHKSYFPCLTVSNAVFFFLTWWKIHPTTIPSILTSASFPHAPSTQGENHWSCSYTVVQQGGQCK